MVAKVAAKYDKLTFCYEAGPTGYGLYRLIRSLGHDGMVAAPSLIPKKPGERVKTNRRDGVSLARPTFRTSWTELGVNFCLPRQPKGVLWDTEEREDLALQPGELDIEDLDGLAVVHQLVPLGEAE